MEQSFAPPAERGCGMRVQNGVYAECGLSPHGRPVEFFLIDPPLPVPDTVLAGLPNIGVQLFERDGIWHVLDRVGLEHYPTPVDFVEEVRRLGVSRRLPRTLDFSKLTPESRLLLVHDRAWFADALDHVPAFRCTREHHKHTPEDMLGADFCAGMWWENAFNGEPASDDDPRDVRCTMPSFQYSARRIVPPAELAYQPAFFMRVPITNIAVIQGSVSDMIAADIRRKTRLEVREVEA